MPKSPPKATNHGPRKNASKNSKREAPQPLPPLTDLLYQALETELGGVEVYRTALQCVQNDDLRTEWEEYLAQTEEHVRLVQELFETFELDPNRDTPGRQVVRTIGKSLVKAMQLAHGSTTPEGAEIVAAECVVLAETKDHANWSLLGKAAAGLTGPKRNALTKVQEQIEDDEDEHLYHTTGWARELWTKALGMKAELPPPEEKKKVKSALAAAKAKGARD